MNRTFSSRIYRVILLAALLAAFAGVLTGARQAQAATLQTRAAANPCLECSAMFKMTTSQTTIAAVDGQIVKFAIKLHNLSMLDRRIGFNAGGSAPWPITLSNQSVLLPPGGDAVVYLKVSVPSRLTDQPSYAGSEDHILFKASDSRNTIYMDLYIVNSLNQ